jgi:PAB-dependent poly(A)-specific ribonuclease subunit 3
MFGSSDFGDSGSLCSVTDFYPGAQTLQARYFSQPGPLLPEEELWSIFMQLLSALTSIHSAGLAYRLLLPSNILVTNADEGAASAGGATGGATCRVRLNSVGIMDALDAMHGVAAPPLPEAQYADLVSLARIMVNLACMSPHAADNLGASLEFIGSQVRAVSILTLFTFMHIISHRFIVYLSAPVVLICAVRWSSFFARWSIRPWLACRVRVCLI